jgi:hypothetical protein
MRCALRRVLATTCHLACLAGAAASVAAQSSRADVVAAQQRAKAASLGREGPSGLEKTTVWVEDLPVFGRTSGFYPWVDNLYPGEGLAGGAGYVRRWGDAAHALLQSGIAPSGSWFVETAAVQALAGRALEASVDGRYMLAKGIAFYGTGPQSGPAPLLEYEYRPATLGATLAVRPTWWVRLSGGYRWLDLRTEPSAPFAPASAPGIGEDLRYDVLRAGVALDWRTESSNSASGGLQRVTLSRYFESRGQPYGFRQIEYEGIQLLPILRRQWVLAFHALATATTAEAGEQVPVVLMPTLGGAETLRGFETRRFTDLNRLLLSAEYRWRPSRYIDMALFSDAGQVAPRWGDIRLSDLEHDFGLGIRVHGPAASGIAARVEAARSDEGWKFIFSGGAAF